MSTAISSSYRSTQAIGGNPTDQLTCRLVVEALGYLRNGQYSKFDPHTTSNGCHGASLHVTEVIRSVLGLGPERIDAMIAEGISLQTIPTCCVELAELLMLTLVTDDNSHRGAITDFAKLLPYGISKKASFKLVTKLQRAWANRITLSYAERSLKLPNGFRYGGVDATLWAKYVGENYLRENERGFWFAPNLYSMQCVMAELSHSKALVGRVVDYKSGDGNTLRGRLITLFQGDGEGGFNRVESASFDQSSPVTILGCCTHSDDPLQVIAARINERSLDALTFAGETQYPEFPFDAPPIVPDEPVLRDVIAAHCLVGGVSAREPTTSCLTHVYVGSVGQTLTLDSLPISYIPASCLSR